MNDRQKYAACFASLEKATPLRLRKIFSYFSDLKQAWRETNPARFIQAGLEPKVVPSFIESIKKINPDKEMEKILKNKVKIYIFGDQDYPKLLKEIYNPPALLFARGELLPEDRFSLGVVGSRVMSPYGRQATSDLVRDIAKQGITIVSGLAMGVDAEAHQAALSVGGRTIAVFGSGVDIIYPPQNKKLATDILSAGGTLISEYSLGAEPTAYAFPQRNRIIAGLSKGVFITEAREKSGALITAKIALNENRDILALPGDIFRESSQGVNQLIKSGAQVVTTAEDILKTLNYSDVPEKMAVEKLSPADGLEGVIQNILNKEPLHIDEIAKKSKISSAEIASALVLLEMKGLAKDLGGMRWVQG